MSNDTESIHEFDFSLICEYFSYTKRQGPGSPAATKRALDFIDNLASITKIADIGCGTGGQTMILAKHTTAKILAIDLFPVFIEKFNTKAQEMGFGNRVKGVVGDMKELPFRDEEYDLIWCEGAIYNIGFRKGISEWHRYLKKGGYLAITEATWFTEERPDEINQFWTRGYPEIDTIATKLAQLQSAGYKVVACFVLPDECWTKFFFEPQDEVQRKFLEKYPNNQSASDLIDNMKYERYLYSKYSMYYGYTFFIGKKL
jgi:SAM-dependent methyltransferase